MTKKHFEDLAARLRGLYPRDGDFFSSRNKATRQAMVKQWEKMVHGIADFCASTNGRFDRDRFLSACQPVEKGDGITEALEIPAQI